jgi:hypothetical protein
MSSMYAHQPSVALQCDACLTTRLVVRRLRWACAVRPISARPASTPLPLTHRKPSSPPLQPSNLTKPAHATRLACPTLHHLHHFPARQRYDRLANDHFHECCVLICYRWCAGTSAYDTIVLTRNSSSASPSTPSTTATGFTFSDPVFRSFDGQRTGSTALSSQSTGAPSRPQSTGYNAGVKAFKHSDRFRI